MACLRKRRVILLENCLGRRPPMTRDTHSDTDEDTPFTSCRILMKYIRAFLIATAAVWFVNAVLIFSPGLPTREIIVSAPSQNHLTFKEACLLERTGYVTTKPDSRISLRHCSTVLPSDRPYKRQTEEPAATPPSTSLLSEPAPYFATPRFDATIYPKSFRIVAGKLICAK